MSDTIMAGPGGVVDYSVGHGSVATASAPRTEAKPAKSAPKTPILSAKDLSKTYRKGAIEVPVLRGVDFHAQPGEFVSIIGQSGSGKSTLLHLLATLDEPDIGEVHFAGKRIDGLPTSERDEVRNKHIGMVFQFYHLLPELTTLENVLLPLMIAESTWSYFWRSREFSDRAEHLLEQVGLSHRLHHVPRELSGGEMQRAAIARALISKPELLLADEPTGNLDSKNGREVMEILQSLNTDHGLTIVMVTHDVPLARQAHRTVRLAEGKVVTGE